MKKRIAGGLVLLIMGVSFMTFQGCKRISGEFIIQYITARASRDQAKQLSLFYMEASIVSMNQVAGKVTNWAVRLYTAENELITEITSDNYESLGWNLVVQRTPVQPYYAGSLSMITNPAVPGDMYDGKTPAKVIVECDILDMNDYATTEKFAAAVAFEEVTE